MKYAQLSTRMSRHATPPILCLAVICMLSACSCVQHCNPPATARSGGINLIELDSVARTTLGDSIIAILSHPVQVSLYTLSPLTRPGDNDPTIGNYLVTKLDTVVPLDYYSILIFLLSDSNNYDNGENIPAIRFMPANALTVVSEADSASLLLSPASMEIGIVHKGVVKNIFRYNNKRLFLLFFNRLLHNEIYDKMLNTFQQ